MAISMVRKPSETPNITNIDDIIPFRYAYGNQNGYVIGKGTELSYTINANTFRINSGRVVLQGVESDIDANGIELVIDIASETRYYIAYYQVNLATNSTNILLSNYDTAGYPMIDLGDDLTVNSSGIARLPLYRFSVANGVIGNVEKVVNQINYTKDIEVENSKKVNGLEIKQDEKGLLKIGNIIIPQRKEVWSGNAQASVGSNEYRQVMSIPINYEFEVGKKYSIEGISTVFGEDYKFSSTVASYVELAQEGVSFRTIAPIYCYVSNGDEGTRSFQIISLEITRDGYCELSFITSDYTLGGTTNRITIANPKFTNSTYSITNIYQIIE